MLTCPTHNCEFGGKGCDCGRTWPETFFRMSNDDGTSRRGVPPEISDARSKATVEVVRIVEYLLHHGVHPDNIERALAVDVSFFVTFAKLDREGKKKPQT